VSPADTNFQVELEFLLKNEEIFARLERETAGIKDELQKAIAVERIWREEIEKARPGLLAQIEAENKLREASAQQRKELQLRIRDIRAQSREIRTSVALMRDSADDLDRIFKPLAVGGALVVGGIFAAANKYVQDAKQATATTVAWKSAQEDLNRSGQRIGEVLAKTALPLLKEAAVVTRQIAGFLERNPGAAEFALKAGLLSLAVGTIGKAVASGIRLIADIKLDAALALQHQAAKLQLIASENQLRAAGIQAQASGGSAITKGGGLAATIGAGIQSPLGIGALIAGNVLVMNALDNQLQKLKETLGGLGNAGKLAAEPVDLLARLIIGINAPLFTAVASFKRAKEQLEDLFDLARDRAAGGAVGKTAIAGRVAPRDPQTEASIVKAFSDWQRDDARIIQEAADRRREIITNSEAAIVSITAAYNNQRKNIIAAAAANERRINESYARDIANLERDYAEQRAQIAADGAQRVADIQAQLEEQLAEMERDHNARVEDAADARDALALEKEEERYDAERAAAIESANREIQAAKAETAKRLAEAAAQYQAQRAQRFEQYQQELKENAEQQAEQLKQAREAHEAQLKAEREQRAKQLRELQEGLIAERLRRRESFIEQIRELDDALLGERIIRQQHYANTLADVEAWAAQYREALKSALGSGTEAPVKDSGGYVSRGLYRMAWDGAPEFVLSNRTTRAAERIVGGQLNQDNFTNMLSLFEGLRNGVTYNDNRNFDSDVSARLRRDLQRDMQETLEGLFRRGYR